MLIFLPDAQGNQRRQELARQAAALPAVWYAIVLGELLFKWCLKYKTKMRSRIIYYDVFSR
jgi:hypothetical protein